MDSWETEIFDSGPYPDESLFVNFFETGEEQRPSRGSHQRNQSAALTMQYPLYPQSHFDTGPIKDEHGYSGRFGGDRTVSEELNAPAAPSAGVTSGAIAPARAAVEPSEVNETSTEATREAARDPKASSVLPSGRRRISKEQTKILEDSFQRNTHLDKAERERVCRETGLMVKNVNIWFQNRRQKAKSQTQTKKAKSDIVGFFANRDKRGGRKRAESTSAAGPAGSVGPSGSGARQSPIVPDIPQSAAAWTPIPTPKTPYRGTPHPSKRNSAQFQGSPTRDLGMQKPLLHQDSSGGYSGLGVSSFELPNSPQQYSPTPSTIGEFSPIQQFPQYIATPKQPWDYPPDPGYAFPTTPGRHSPTRAMSGNRSLIQSPQLMARNHASSPQNYSAGGSRAALAGSLARSKSAAEIAPIGPSSSSNSISQATDFGLDQGQYPELKRRCSNYGRSHTLHGLSNAPVFPSSANSTAGNSTQVSPHSSPPALHTTMSSTNIAKAANTPFDAIGAAQAQRMMASRARSHTQPSLRYDSGARLHLDDSNHQAVLVRVDRSEQQQTPPPVARPPLRSRSTVKVPTTLNAGIHIPPPQDHTTVSPQQYMIDKNTVFYDESVWQGSSFAPEDTEDVEDTGFFHFPSSDS